MPTPILHGELVLPGDKSISHRALMLLGISGGSANIRNLSNGQDVLSTLRCMQALGCPIQKIDERSYTISGAFPIRSPEGVLDCGNSGTTIRLLSGLLGGVNGSAVLTGDESLQKRPMHRVIAPLRQMGANIEALGPNDCAPLRMTPSGGLHGICYSLPMASAQVKSAILLAGLFASSTERILIQEPVPSRDHTERMLKALGADIGKEENRIELLGRQSDLVAQDIQVPGDISSAAFWLVGAGILPGSHLCIRQVSLNPLRLGIFEILRQIGLEITLHNVTEDPGSGEPYGDLWIDSQPLQGNIEITPGMIPSLIDEIPVLTILGLFTDGVFTLQGAKELRFKESDRLAALIDILKVLKVDFMPLEDGFSFQGHSGWQVPEIEEPLKTHHDHRLVMALEILNLRAAKPLPVEGKEWVSISYPGFYETLSRLVTQSSSG